MASWRRNALLIKGNDGAMWLDEATWELVRDSVPVPCVDLIPLRERDGATEVGLIERQSPFGVRWCQIGGRLQLGETLRDGLLRHVAHTLTGLTFELAADPQPDYVMQWFREEIPAERDGVAYGFDPRVHAVCFGVPASGEPAAVSGGEAFRFAWFDVPSVRALGEAAWPGTAAMITAVTARVAVRQS
jgi:ADP-ribose pyrophosphatase YjhB (NUDIX family)